MSCGNPHDTPCSEVDAHLDEYLDRELSPEDIAMLDQHFRECPPCRSELELAVRLKLLVAKACGCDAPEALRQRIARRITEIRTGSMTISVEETRVIGD